MDKKVDYADLIGRKWELPEFDCLEASAEILRRAEMSDAATSLLMCREAGQPGNGWEKVSEKPGDATMIGDLVLSILNGALHICAVCDVSRGLAFSSSISDGGYAYRVDRSSAVLGVYRYAG